MICIHWDFQDALQLVITFISCSEVITWALSWPVFPNTPNISSAFLFDWQFIYKMPILQTLISHFYPNMTILYPTFPPNMTILHPTFPKYDHELSHFSPNTTMNDPTFPQNMILIKYSTMHFWRKLQNLYPNKNIWFHGIYTHHRVWGLAHSVNNQVNIVGSMSSYQWPAAICLTL